MANTPRPDQAHHAHRFSGTDWYSVAQSIHGCHIGARSAGSTRHPGRGTHGARTRARRPPAPASCREAGGGSCLSANRTRSPNCVGWVQKFHRHDPLSMSCSLSVVSLQPTNERRGRFGRARTHSWRARCRHGRGRDRFGAPWHGQLGGGRRQIGRRRHRREPAPGAAGCRGSRHPSRSWRKTRNWPGRCALSMAAERSRWATAAAWRWQSAARRPGY